jgi:DNA-binding XRE family transcriptional regulator
MKTASQLAAEKAANPTGKRAAPQRRHFNCPNKLAELREKSGLSLGDVEKSTGVGSQTISAAEKGGDVSISRALTLAKFWEMPLTDIYTGEVNEAATAPAGTEGQ